ncbi:flagellar biosynthetic protein FliR [Falsirhodobacter sp. alg1]|uniref:flagellar biosynthetic protein FliR n=1 Tax=Falsirhodobacter sp. alg1 TaxID=1472418 RepID=UPI0005EE1B18|nr:flagellar biosynthetic protein FliR [Falsirhodobacter sp. alg1]
MTELFAALTQMTGEATDLWRQAFIIFIRVGAMAALMPGFGEQTIPARVRLIIALAFTMVVAPAVHVPDMGMGGYAGELASGLALGFGLRLFVMVLQTGGAIIAQATSLSQILGGAGEAQPAIGHLLTYAGLALAMAADLHLRLAELIILSYRILPAGGIPDPSVIAEWGVGQVAHAFRLAFGIAAPFVAGSLVYNVAIGVINRAMPQLMMSMVFAPALTLGGLILLAIVAPISLGVWIAAFNVWLGNPFTVLP